MCNNSNYGMTGGQYSATTPTGSYTKTSVYGHMEPNFNVCKLAEGAGATYVARCTTYHVNEMVKLMAGALEHKGLSVVEAMCDCVSLYGRLNKLGTPADMVLRWKDICVSKSKAEQMGADELAGKLIDKGFAAGFPLGRYYADRRDQLLIAVTEKRTKEEIKALANAMEALL